ncbi:hypothetical protein Pmani_036977 [Petrolisthes manimaculis]|uniref:ELMO domain-containing protein n=1 Tax=Petrolisthes manimaculis TaxID=1843537 RepID=A0AAE1NIN7_9EUCA|nr:hypothetical protein Pmani_036977 [Petrolisthes manimaculis]
MHRNRSTDTTAQTTDSNGATGGRKGVVRTESLRSERSDKRVSFNKDVGIKHIPRGGGVASKGTPGGVNRVGKPPGQPTRVDEWAACSQVHREPVTQDRLEEEAENVVRLIDNVNCNSLDRTSRGRNANAKNNNNNNSYAHHTYNNVLFNNNRNNRVNGDVRSRPKTLPTPRTTNPINRKAKGDVNREGNQPITRHNNNHPGEQHFDQPRRRSADTIPESHTPTLQRHHQHHHHHQQQHNNPHLFGHKSVPDLNAYLNNESRANYVAPGSPHVGGKRGKHNASVDNLYHDRTITTTTTTGHSSELRHRPNHGYKSVENLVGSSPPPNRLQGFKSVGHLPSASYSDSDSGERMSRPTTYRPKVGNIIRKFNQDIEENRRPNLVPDPDPGRRGTLEPDRYRNHNNNQPFSYTGASTVAPLNTVRRLSPPPRDPKRPTPPRDSPSPELPVYAQVNKSRGRDMERNYRNRSQMDAEYSAKIIITDDDYDDYGDHRLREDYRDGDDDAYESYQVPQDNFERLISDKLHEYKEHSNNNINMSSVGVQTEGLAKARMRSKSPQKGPVSSSTRMYGQQQEKRSNNTSTYHQSHHREQREQQHQQQRNDRQFHNNLTSASLVRQVNHGFGRTDRSPSPPPRASASRQPRRNNVVPLLSDTSDSETEHTRRRTVDPLARIRDQVMQREKLQEEEEEEEGRYRRPGRPERKEQPPASLIPYSEEMTPLTIDEVDALSLVMDETGKNSLVVSNQAQSSVSMTRVSNHKSRSHERNQLSRDPTPPRRRSETPTRKDVEKNVKKNNLEKEKKDKKEKEQQQKKKKKRIKIKFFYDPRPQDEPHADPLANFTEFKGDGKESPRDDRRERSPPAPAPDERQHERSPPPPDDRDRRGDSSYPHPHDDDPHHPHHHRGDPERSDYDYERYEYDNKYQRRSQERDQYHTRTTEYREAKERRVGSREHLDSRDRVGSRERLDSRDREHLDSRDRVGSRERLDSRDRVGSRERLDYDDPKRRGSKDSYDHNNTRTTRDRTTNKTHRHHSSSSRDDPDRPNNNNNNNNNNSQHHRSKENLNRSRDNLRRSREELDESYRNERKNNNNNGYGYDDDVPPKEHNNKNNNNNNNGYYDGDDEIEISRPGRTLSEKYSNYNDAATTTTTATAATTTVAAAASSTHPIEASAEENVRQQKIQRQRKKFFSAFMSEGKGGKGNNNNNKQNNKNNSKNNDNNDSNKQHQEGPTSWESATLARAELRSRQVENARQGGSRGGAGGVSQGGYSSLQRSPDRTRQSGPPPTTTKPRYFGDTDLESERGGGSRPGRGRSNRSVFLHATAVADIPGRRGAGGGGGVGAGGDGDESNTATPSERTARRESKKVSRSFSLLAPWKPRHYREKYEVEYDNREAERGAGGAKGALPPRPPRRPAPERSTGGGSSGGGGSRGKAHPLTHYTRPQVKRMAPARDSRVVKLAVEMRITDVRGHDDKPIPYLGELSQQQPLAAFIVELCGHWKLERPELYALQYTEPTAHYVNEKNRGKIKDGTVLNLVNSAARTADDTLNRLRKGNVNERRTALDTMVKMAPDVTFASEVVGKQGISLLIECMQSENNDSTLLPSILTSFLELMDHGILSWEELQPAFIEKVASYINLQMAVDPRTLCTSLTILENIILNSPSRYPVVEKQIVLPKLLQHLQVTQGTKRSDIQHSVLALVNALIQKSEPQKRKYWIHSLSTRQYRTNINNNVLIHAEGGGIGTDMAHQLYVLQQLILNQYDERMNTRMETTDSDATEKIKELRRIAFESDGEISSSVTPRRAEYKREYRKLGFRHDINPAQDFMVTPPGVLALDNMVFFARTHSDQYAKLVLENCYRADSHECPFGRASIELTKLLCEILQIGETPTEEGQTYHPMLFSHDHPLEELFSVCVVLLNKTWKEMKATTEDFSKVLSVVKDQIIRTMELLPSTLEVFKAKINNLTYAEIAEIWQQERINNEEQEMQAPPIKELRKQLEPEVMDLIQEHRLRYLVEGTRFKSARGVRPKDKFRFVRLSPNHKFLHYDDCDEKATPSLDDLTKKVSILELRGLLTGRDCPHMKEKTGKKSNYHLAFSLLLDSQNLNDTNQHLDFVSPDETTFNYWVDGINALLRQPMTSISTVRDLETLVNMEVKVRLLDAEGVTIPSQQPYIPIPPPNYNFCYQLP